MINVEQIKEAFEAKRMIALKQSGYTIFICNTTGTRYAIARINGAYIIFYIVAVDVPFSHTHADSLLSLAHEVARQDAQASAFAVTPVPESYTRIGNTHIGQAGGMKLTISKTTAGWYGYEVEIDGNVSRVLNASRGFKPIMSRFADIYRENNA